QREDHLEAAAFSQRAVNRDGAAERGHQLVNVGETEPQPLEPARNGQVALDKGIKEMGHLPSTHADAGVPDGDAYGVGSSHAVGFDPDSTLYGRELDCVIQ